MQLDVHGQRHSRRTFHCAQHSCSSTSSAVVFVNTSWLFKQGQRGHMYWQGQALWKLPCRAASTHANSLHTSVYNLDTLPNHDLYMVTSMTL